MTAVKITFPGFPGTYWQPPEPAEGIAWCPECDQETDVTLSEFSNGNGTIDAECVAGHTFEVDDPAEPDPDAEYEKWRDEREEW